MLITSTRGILLILLKNNTKYNICAGYSLREQKKKKKRKGKYATALPLPQNYNPSSNIHSNPLISQVEP